MKDYPLGFSTPMVVGLWNGTKTMTRRIGTKAVPYSSPICKVQPGDRIWVREGFALANERVYYMADHPKNTHGVHLKWKPWIHLPKPASRMTLVVTAVRFERLQDITEEDCAAEGIGAPYFGDGDPPFVEPGQMISRRQQFRNLWAKLHGTQGWENNPYVTVISFIRHRININEFAEAA